MGATIMCRVRKLNREQAGTWNQMTRQAWEKLLRTSQLYFPPQNCKQMFPEINKAGIITSKNRLTLYSLIKFHKSGAMGIISHMDTSMCRILLLRAHSKPCFCQICSQVNIAARFLSLVGPQ